MRTNRWPRTGEHICGLYYLRGGWSVERVYLPQVKLKAHATIISTTSRTVLSQTFANPSDNETLREVRYAFPLYDGASVVGFTCQVGSRVIVGEVKGKEKAKAVFKEAVQRGETAGLFEQLPEASDVFTTTVGNIPAGERVIITITYLGELKHDMEVDGTRFTIPTVVCPRYGHYPDGLQTRDLIASGTDIAVTVDAEVAEGTFIQQILSPSHPIAVSMGTSSVAPDATPRLNKASVTLSLGKANLDTEFVLKIIAKDTGVPRAILQTHPTLPNHRALMATLVPKFALTPEKPEIVFVCDRSGSMGGTRITLAIQALKVFLKSLPVGVKFNICSFGSNYSFLWPKSVTYSQETLDKAMQHVDIFRADYGGTEMLTPLREIVNNRYQDIPLDIMLLTDGEIWNQQALFDFLNGKIAEEKAPIRVFTLGVGTGVSHALIEGVARAGNGFSQSVGEGEVMDSKVVRMLKGALSPHISDYSLEVKYAQSAPSQISDDDDDFELIERVTDSLQVKLDLRETQSTAAPVRILVLQHLMKYLLTFDRANRSLSTMTLQMRIRSPNRRTTRPEKHATRTSPRFPSRRFSKHRRTYRLCSLSTAQRSTSSLAQMRPKRRPNPLSCAGQASKVHLSLKFRSKSSTPPARPFISSLPRRRLPSSSKAGAGSPKPETLPPASSSRSSTRAASPTWWSAKPSVWASSSRLVGSGARSLRWRSTDTEKSQIRNMLKGRRERRLKPSTMRIWILLDQIVMHPAGMRGAMKGHLAQEEGHRVRRNL